MRGSEDRYVAHTGRRSFALCLLECACTVATYPGSRRPRDEVAIVQSRDTTIDEVDGREAGLFTNEFEVLPGQHSVVARVSAKRDNMRASSLEGLRVCFVAERGRTYLVAPYVLTSRPPWRWTAQIIDKSNQTRVDVHYPRPGQTDCPVPLHMPEQPRR